MSNVYSSEHPHCHLYLAESLRRIKCKHCRDLLQKINLYHYVNYQGPYSKSNEGFLLPTTAAIVKMQKIGFKTAVSLSKFIGHLPSIQIPAPAQSTFSSSLLSRKAERSDQGDHALSLC